MSFLKLGCLNKVSRFPTQAIHDLRENAILKALCLDISLWELANGYLLQKKKEIKGVTYMYLKLKRINIKGE